jgi:hypothetical protein
LQLPDDPEESLRLALKANDLEQSRDTEDALRTILRALRVQAVLRGAGPSPRPGSVPTGSL